jgi:polyhydroxyalkanoate synthesis regulator phasin
MADLDELTERLERLATELRTGELEAAQAAELVDECARLAGEAAAELDRRARDTEAPPGQTELL